jgi:hypothetical protein
LGVTITKTNSRTKRTRTSLAEKPMSNDHGNADGTALSSPNIHEVSIQQKQRNSSPKTLSPAHQPPLKETKMTTSTRSNATKGDTKLPAKVNTPNLKLGPNTTTTEVKNTPAAVKPAKKPALITPTNNNGNIAQKKAGRNMEANGDKNDEKTNEEDEGNESPACTMKEKNNGTPTEDNKATNGNEEGPTGQLLSFSKENKGEKKAATEEDPVEKEATAGTGGTKGKANTEEATEIDVAEESGNNNGDNGGPTGTSKSGHAGTKAADSKEEEWKTVTNGKSHTTGKQHDPMDVEETEKEKASDNRTTPATAFRIPMNVRILAKKSGNRDADYNVHTIMTDIFTKLQKVHEKTWIGPIDPNDSDLEPILSPTEVPSEEAALLEYAENPTPTKRGHFHMRMYIHADIEFYKFKQDQALMQWLFKEKITIAISLLATSNPQNVGFFVQLHPRMDLLPVYTNRLKILLPAKNFPPYQLTTVMLFAGEAKTKVVLVSAAKEDVERLALLFLSAGMESDQIDFYSWLEYTSLNRPRRLTLVNQQNEFITMSRTLIVRGFHDTNPIMNTEVGDQTMQDSGTSEDTEETDKATDDADKDNKPTVTKAAEIDLTKTTMTDYIQQKFKAGDGTNLFTRVHPPAGGVMTCLLKPHHNNEAQSLFRFLPGELARDMCDASLQQALLEPDEARDAARSSDPWQPFTVSSRIAETNPTATSTKNLTKRPKRPKQGRVTFTPTLFICKSSLARRLTKHHNRPNRYDVGANSDQQIQQPRGLG